jgi:acyl-CoA reductase-like NAD-dependent aldehyde dehydrogenase
MSPYERELHLLRIADMLKAHAGKLAVIQSPDLGALLPMSTMLVWSAVTAFPNYAGWVTKIAGQRC